MAEVQNVRVGGDVTVRAFHRENLNLSDNDETIATLRREDDFLMSTVGVNIGADLTENVAAFIRLANERDWNVPTAATGDFDLSQAYVKLKNAFYSPVDVTVGTQPIVWGRGFVLGSNLIPGLINGGGDRNDSITANEFTDFTAFDAIRATLDLSGAAAVDLPVSLDYVYVKQDERTIGLPDDVTLQGVNLSTRLEDQSAELETYFLNKRDKVVASALNPDGRDGSVTTVGLRGSVMPADGTTVWGEAAYQFGKRTTDPAGVQISGDSQQAWAFNLGAEMGFADAAMMPSVGAEWIFFSGKDVDGAVGGWDPMARGYFTTALREFQNPTAAAFYPPTQLCFSNGTVGNPCTGSATNQHQLSVFGSLMPIEDLTVSNRLSVFILDVGALPSGAGAGSAVSKRQRFAGTEWDAQVVYDYTDDVQLGVLYALFLPGSTYRQGRDSSAQEVVTSVSVKF
ncbi:MAG TPA: alginate export family protein [bacterium]